MTNFGALLGCQQAGEVVDLSPPVGDQGIDWVGVGSMRDRVVPADLLYCQASISLEVMRRFRELCPRAPIVLQRDSTHAQVHLDLMEAAMRRHDVRWVHQYADHDRSLLKRECLEYELADRIFVLSRWVKGSFEHMGMGPKTVQFSSQLAQTELWGPPVQGWVGKGPRLTAIAVGQTGLRKGTFDLLEAWRLAFQGRHPGRLIICGLPENGAPPELAQKLEAAYKATPGVEVRGWVDMRSMRSLYGLAHVLVSASVEEGSTMPGVEAALCGLPAIATPNSGIDLLAPGVTGWEVPPSDPRAMAAAIAAASSALQSGVLGCMGEVAMHRARTCGVDAYSAGVAAALRRVMA